MKNGVSTTLDDLIRLALTDQRYNQQRLGNQAYRYTRRITNRLCSDLPEDLHFDIFHQAFAELFAAGPDAIATRTPTQAFRRAVFAAIRAVRASYAPPGQRTRYSAAAADEPAKIAAEDIGRVLSARDLEQCMVAEGDDQLLDLDRVASSAAAEAIKQVEDRLTADAILAHAAAPVAAALRLIHVNDEPVEMVAAALGVSRFTLNRRITAFTKGWRAAA